MGAALVKGWLRAADAPALIIWDQVEAAMRGVLVDGRVKAAASLEELVVKADVILLVVKPKDAEGLLSQVAGLLRREQIVVSAMAGVSLAWLRSVVGEGPELLRIMPNLAVEAGAGAVVVAVEPGSSVATLEIVLPLLRGLGLVEVLAEDSFDAVTAVSSSSPAFLAVAIEGLEDGAVAAGLSRAAARRVVRQAALAAVAVAPDDHSASDTEPERAAMKLVEQRGVRPAFRRAVGAAVERCRQIREERKEELDDRRSPC
jgi:pyrroline-5-carboxylate reductase